jgi:hypothetical protein
MVDSILVISSAGGATDRGENGAYLSDLSLGWILTRDSHNCVLNRPNPPVVIPATACARRPRFHRLSPGRVGLQGIRPGAKKNRDVTAGACASL